MILSLLGEEQIVWTVPVPLKIRRLVEQARNGSRNGGQPHIELPPLVQYRLTFGTTTLVEEAKREEVLRVESQRFEQQYGIVPATFHFWFVTKFMRNDDSGVEFTGSETMSRAEASVIMARLADMADWATIMVCLNSVAMRKVPLLHEEEWDNVSFEPIAIPAEWLDFESFMLKFPRKLHTSCLDVCNQLNPGVWRVSEGGECKHIGGVTV